MLKIKIYAPFDKFRVRSYFLDGRFLAANEHDEQATSNDNQ